MAGDRETLGEFLEALPQFPERERVIAYLKARLEAWVAETEAAGGAEDKAKPPFHPEHLSPAQIDHLGNPQESGRSNLAEQVELGRQIAGEAMGAFCRELIDLQLAAVMDLVRNEPNRVPDMNAIGAVIARGIETFFQDLRLDVPAAGQTRTRQLGAALLQAEVMQGVTLERLLKALTSGQPQTAGIEHVLTPFAANGYQGSVIDMLPGRIGEMTAGLQFEAGTPLAEQLYELSDLMLSMIMSLRERIAAVASQDTNKYGNQAIKLGHGVRMLTGTSLAEYDPDAPPYNLDSRDATDYEGNLLALLITAYNRLLVAEEAARKAEGGGEQKEAAEKLATIQADGKKLLERLRKLRPEQVSVIVGTFAKQIGTSRRAAIEVVISQSSLPVRVEDITAENPELLLGMIIASEGGREAIQTLLNRLKKK